MIEITRIDPHSLYDERLHLMWKAFLPHDTLEKAARLAGTLLDNQATFVARDGSTLAAMVCVKEPIENRIRGAHLSFGGIGEVCTLPEYRRDRLVRSLFDQVFAYMQEADVVYSALGPFSYPFYEKFGYAHAEQGLRYAFPANQLKAPRHLAGFTFREYAEADAGAVMQAQRSMARFGSRVFKPVKKLPGDHPYVVEQHGQVRGFVRLSFSRLGEHETGANVCDAWFSTDEVFPAIVDLVYRYASQSSKITWHIEPEVPLEYYIKEPGQAERQRTGYMMVRVVKFKEFCQQVKVPLYAAEPVIIRLVDPLCPWNEGSWKLTPVSGRLEIQPSSREPEITLDAVHLSHAVGGLLTANRLHRLGGLHCAADAAERFTRIFPPESYVSYVGF
ncbi:MAG: GNAT family N-acetyltransferase [Anaerolineae bacterium]|nr:GNAT family N-acetyltransferase [Anaerolineae bacterium]